MLPEAFYCMWRSRTTYHSHNISEEGMEGIRECDCTAIGFLCLLKSPGTLSEMPGLGLICFQVKLHRPLTVILEYKSW